MNTQISTPPRPTAKSHQNRPFLITVLGASVSSRATGAAGCCPVFYLLRSVMTAPVERVCAESADGFVLPADPRNLTWLVPA